MWFTKIKISEEDVLNLDHVMSFYNKHLHIVRGLNENDILLILLDHARITKYAGALKQALHLINSRSTEEPYGEIIDYKTNGLGMGTVDCARKEFQNVIG